jgi:16S rRNA (adenine1518-N6/adenine1519-N6)-dimethyltransferase
MTEPRERTSVMQPPSVLLKKYGLSPRKRWGQNFLHDPHVHGRIVAASEARAGSRVVEIGAGLGTLTGHLLATGAEVQAIERDRDLCVVLRAELAGHPRFTLHEADAVRFDYGQASDEMHPRPSVVGNLPYHLTGELLFALLRHHDRTGTWVVMVQREVADRLCASPGSRTYGGVTVMMSRVRRVTRVCRVGAGSFIPPPRVESAVVRLDPLPQPRGEVVDEERFRLMVRAAFTRRRKQLVNALTAVAPREIVRHWCELAGVDPTIRPEKLGPEAFAALERTRDQAENA